MNVAERFGENLRRARKQAGLSQEALAFAASLHRTEISLLERAGRTPRIDSLVKLSSALGVAPEALLEGIAWEVGQVRSGRFAVASERPSKEAADE